MACGPGSTTVTKAVYSVGTAGSGEIFHVLARVEENDAANAKISYMLQSATGNLEVIPATRGTKDGFTYGSVVNWNGASYLSTNNTWTWGSAYSAPDDDYETIEFGFNVRNKSGGGTVKEAAIVTLVIDIRK